MTSEPSAAPADDHDQYCSKAEAPEIEEGKEEPLHVVAKPNAFRFLVTESRVTILPFKYPIDLVVVLAKFLYQ